MEQLYDRHGTLIREGDVLFDFDYQTGHHVTRPKSDTEDTTLGFYVDSEFYPLSDMDLDRFVIMPKTSTTVGSFDKQVMDACIQFAQSTMTMGIGGPFGAAVVKDKQIISIASNRVLADKDPTAHAEMVAIRRACERLGTHDLLGCELYATGYPCPMCLSAIIWSNIKKVYYGNTKEDAANIEFRDDYIYSYIKSLTDNTNDNSVLKLEYIDREETIETFNQFIEKSDKTIY